MGLFKKLGSAFSRSSDGKAASPAPSKASRPPASRPPKPTASPGVNGAGSATATATLDPPASGRLTPNGSPNGVANGASSAVMTRRTEPASPATSPRNKQELLEELQKNYQEVVELVRKVDAHLDRDETRAGEFVSIARRVDEALPTLREAPEELRTTLQTLSERVTEAIERASTVGDQRVARLETALTRISDTLDAHGASQRELTTTMASFRETLGDIAATSERTGNVLERVEKRQAEREAETASLLKSSRNWLLASLAISVAVATAAMAIAVVSMLGAG